MSRARSRERAIQQFQDVLCAQCASRHRFLRSAEPDIHLPSRAPKSRHRRLSLCSLPVRKQFVESLGSVISFAQSAIGRTWQSAHFVRPVCFGQYLCCRSPAFFRRNKVSLLLIHGEQIRDHLPSDGERRTVAISFLLFPVVDHGSLCLGASLAASTSTCWICLLRCFDSGMRIICPPSFVSLRRVRNS